MKTHLLIFAVIFFIVSMFRVSAQAATQQWSYEYANTNTTVKKIYADGKGGVAVFVYDKVIDKNVLIWLDKKGKEIYKTIGLGMKIIGCNKKNLVVYFVDSEKVYQIDRNGQSTEISEAGKKLDVPNCMEWYEDKKGFFVARYTTATAVTEIVRYLYK